MYSSERFSTRGMAPHERMRAWGRDAWASIGGLEIHALTPGEDFEADLSSRPLGPLRLCRVSVGRHRSERTPQLVRANDRDLLQALATSVCIALENARLYKETVAAAAHERDVRRMEGIICSMTPLERRKPELIKASRKRRIATGAGVMVQDVNRMLNQFEQMQGMMKKMKGGGLMKMMKRMGGMKGMPKMPF